ncbi:MAG: hypothetical protein ABIU96_13895 [Rhodanobacter sp.]
MLNTFAKFMLVATSLSPVLGAVAVNKFARGEAWSSWSPWLIATLLLILLCWVLLRYIATNGQKHVFRIKEFERDEKEVLAFLLAYLLPFVSSEKLGFAGDWLTGTYVLGIIFLVVAHAGAFHFNPVMGLLGYHFYSVKNADGVSYLLISRKELRRPGTSVAVVEVALGIYLQTGDADA